MLHLKIIICIIFSMAWSQHFQVNLSNTGQTQLTIFSNSITALEVGDEIGIFDENAITNYNNCSNELGELLVGAGLWNGSQLEIVSIGSVDMCAFGGVQISGFVEGNSVIVKVWRDSEQMEYGTELTWGAGIGIFGDIIQSIDEIVLVDPNICEDDDAAMAALGDCAGAVAALGCDFVFGGEPISESCPVTCDACPEGPVWGCTDDTACNYDNTATDNDGCEYAEENFDCDGSCLVDIDCAGECGGHSWESDCGCVAADNSGNDCDDCAGNPDGFADFDDCGVCEGGNADLDCAGICAPGTSFGDYHFSIGLEYGAFFDDCDVCSGGESNHNSNSDLDECGICFGAGIPEGDCDCDGNVVDECDICGGDGSECSGDGGDGDGDADILLSFGELGGIILITLNYDNAPIGEICIENPIFSDPTGNLINTYIGQCFSNFSQSGEVDVHILNSIGVSGFQFNITGAEIISTSGGAAADAGFMVSSSGTSVLGFSLTGSIIEAQDDNIVGCNDNEFDCGSDSSPYGQCIYGSWACDGYVDCYNGSDEADCSDGGDGGGTEISYENDIQPIFDANCTSYCHSDGGNYTGGLDLTSYENLMLGTSDHGPIINPGYASYSILIQKLSDSPPFGEQMPSNQPPLDGVLISLISDWINAGAIGPDNNEPGEDIYGCTNSIAENYNPDATIDDGSCIYPPLGELSFSNFLDSPNDEIDYATFNIELDCEYPVSQFEIEISGIEIVDVMGLGAVTSFELLFTDSTIVGSYTNGYIPEHYGAIIEIIHTSSFESLIDPTICFDDSKITTYVGVEYEAILEGCVTPGCMDEFGDNYNSSATHNDESCIEPSDTIIDYSISLHDGANLISLYALPDNPSVANVMSSLDGIVTGVIGEGVAASPNPVLGWVGSLSEFAETSGYWVKVNTEATLIVDDAIPLDPALVYDLHAGANLVSFPYEGLVGIAEGLPDDIEGLVTGVIGEGVAASPNPVLGWVGSLSSWEGTKGYWLKMSTDASFSFNIPDGLVRESLPVDIQKAPIGFDYAQSTQQAFYFVEDIVLNGESIQDGDWVMAYNGNVLVGARQWNGAYTDIPVMGYDSHVETAGYLENGETPTFKVIKEITGGEFILSGNLPVWANNELYTVGVMEDVVFPSTIVLQEVYPNPFNPSTNIEFGLSNDAEVHVIVYDIAGREMAVLAQGQYNKGFHNVIWDATDQPSGIYFVTVSTQLETQSQKLMLIK